MGYFKDYFCFGRRYTRSNERKEMGHGLGGTSLQQVIALEQPVSSMFSQAGRD